MHNQTNVLLWRGQTTNTKTGNIPTAYVRRSHYDAGCVGCPHYGRPDTRPEEQRNKSGRRGISCYAHSGRVAQAARAMERKADREPIGYTVEGAMMSRVISARYARLTAIGDPTAAPREELEDALHVIRSHGLRAIVYTAQWWKRSNAWLQPFAMASVANDGAERRARSLGWRVARTIDADRFARSVRRHLGSLAQSIPIEGAPHLTACPAQVSTLTGTPAVTCNDCGLCSQDSSASVAFAEHGSHAGGRSWTRLVRAWQEARA